MHIRVSSSLVTYWKLVNEKVLGNSNRKKGTNFEEVVNTHGCAAVTMIFLSAPIVRVRVSRASI
jgi:hypothetical protein